LNSEGSHSGLFIVDSSRFIRFELKEPRAEDFSEAIGFVIYSNSKVGLDSSKVFFELLWNERIQYEKLREYERLKDIQRMKDEFINIAAHELRTPIQPILGLSEVLQSKIKDVKQRQLLDTITRNAKRLQRLTDDILDVTKIESQSLKLNKERCNLNDVITNVIDDMIINREFKKENNNGDDNIKLEYRPKDIFVEVDRVRVTQVISNLLNNAIKFTKEGKITITIEKKDNEEVAVISIKDTGIGIDSEVFPKLFSKFASKSYQGTGLGLFICKSVIEAHDGKIWAENNNNNTQEKKGATFYFTLPTINRQQDVKVVDQ